MHADMHNEHGDLVLIISCIDGVPRLGVYTKRCQIQSSHRNFA